MVMQIGLSNPKNQYSFGGESLRCVDNEKDLGVTFNSSFSFEDHVRNSIAKANGTIAWVTRNVISREPSVMLGFYKSLIKPHIEYCSQAWAPMARHGNWSLILELEAVQRSFTRMIDGLGLMTYRERLDKLNLTTLLERRVRGDLIVMFKIQEDFVRRIVTDQSLFKFRLSEMLGFFINSDYPRILVQNVFDRVVALDRCLDYKRKVVDSSGNFEIPWLVTFGPGYQEVRKFVEVTNKALQQSPLFRSFSTPVLGVVTRRASNLKDDLFNQKKIFSSTSSVVVVVVVVL